MKAARRFGIFLTVVLTGASWAFQQRRLISYRQNHITITSSSCFVSSTKPTKSNHLGNQTAVNIYLPKKGLSLSQSSPLTKRPSPKERIHAPNAVRAVSWNAKFDQLVAFRQKYGHVNVPQNPTKEIPERYPQLAHFCRNVRNQYRLLQNDDTRHLSFLTRDRIERLESIGFVWNAHEEAWQSKYEELVKFQKQYGHCNVPLNWKDNPNLRNWVGYQRLRYKAVHQKYKPLAVKQIELLEIIDFRWSPKDELWWNNYAELKAYQEQNGHFNTSCASLRQWKDSLKRTCREYVLAVSIEGTTDSVHVSGLNLERLDALRAIRFCWLPPPSGPLKEDPPPDISCFVSSTKPTKSNHLGNQTAVNIYLPKKGLSLSQSSPLTKRPSPKERIHAPNTVRAVSWNAKFDQLVAFRQKYGHVNVPQNPTKEIPERYPQLAHFCRNVRNQYRLLQNDDTRHLSFLTRDRIERLESIGFVWNAHEEAWQSKYEELVKFQKQYGHCNVPLNWKDNPDLRNWVGYQRLRYKAVHQKYKPLAVKQIELLEIIDFRWSKDELWWNNYAELKAYQEQNGHFNTSCASLRQWKDSLKRTCREYVLAVSIEGTTDSVHVSGLNLERLDALRAIRFCWLPPPSGPLKEDPPPDIFAGYH